MREVGIGMPSIFTTKRKYWIPANNVILEIITIKKYIGREISLFLKTIASLFLDVFHVMKF